MILTNPDVIAITAKNRMQNVQSHVTFGAKAPQTIHFIRSTSVGLDNPNVANFELAKKLAGTLVDQKVPVRVRSSKTIFSQVPHEHIAKFLRAFRFEPSSSFFRDPDLLADWLLEVASRLKWKPWNVAFVGPQSQHGVHLAGNYSWKRTTRAAIAEPQKDYEKRFYIKTLRDPADLSVDMEEGVEYPTLEDRRSAMEASGNLQPLLLLYLIDGNSKANRDISWEDTEVGQGRNPKEEQRCNLDSVTDLVGLSLVWPGGRSVTENIVSVQLRPIDRDEGDLAGTENDEVLQEGDGRDVD